MASRVEAMASRVEAMASHTEAMASHVEAMASHVEAMASHVEAMASHTEAMASRVESVGSAGHFGADYADLLGFSDKVEFDPWPEPPTGEVFEDNQDWSARQKLPPWRFRKLAFGRRRATR
jgi:outer membrane murein-binding lipoprotein Lpp